MLLLLWHILTTTWVLCFIGASMCDSVMDTTKDKWSESSFTLFHPWTLIYKFFLWDSWRNKYTDRNQLKGRWKVKILGIWIMVPVQITDAWHFFKMWMVVLLACATVYYEPILPKIHGLPYYDFALCGLLWNLPFNFFFNTGLKLTTFNKIKGFFNK